MKPIRYFLALGALPWIFQGVLSAAEPTGEELFTLNCSACHLLDETLVGPSLVEIRTLYAGRADEFVKWAVAPYQKRPNGIEMPSMVHLGEANLHKIYEHVMNVSKGVRRKKQFKGDPYAASPTQAKRPMVQRLFMPDAGPAAIAVALDEKNSLCWDAGTCRLRYAWSGGFINGFPYWSGNGSGMTRINGDIRYTENESPLPLEGEVKFSGYQVKDGLPVFRYSIGTTEITESFSPVSEGEGFQRSFTIHPAPAKPVTLHFPETAKTSYSSNKGSWDGSNLTLTATEAAEFTLTFSFK
ncbi:hypothetical protein ACFSSA_06130 [Luteolibacter algae]|uniref:Cytochrome c domain-containing protein n=1 Tax=Luteolibacter algae TaxID=454151 RepID=A0ABW5D588_9BACT